VVDALRRHLQGNGTDEKTIPESNRDLIERYLLRVPLRGKEITLHLRRHAGASESAHDHDDPKGARQAATTIAIPWTVSTAAPTKGIIYVPAHSTPMKPGRRETLLITIAKARRWIKDLERGQSFAEIARREGKTAPLRPVSPRRPLPAGCPIPGPSKNNA
jgi:hypothetical protein